MKKVLVLFLGFLALNTNARQYEAYSIFDEKGKHSDFKKLLKEAKDADVIFFGELHNNPIAHWLQLLITQELATEKEKHPLVLGAEMFESDNQILLDEYFAGIISQKSFENEARIWSNYATDYKPLVEFAKENSIPFIATNVPRRYASAVYMQGEDVLKKVSAEGKTFLCPLPFVTDLTLPGYKEMLKMSEGHGGDNIVRAQALKDATMAHFIAKNLKKGGRFLHFNGAYHSDNFEGIIWHLNKYQSGLKIFTISTVMQADTEKLSDENKGKANFIICVPENMTTTH